MASSKRFVPKANGVLATDSMSGPTSTSCPTWCPKNVALCLFRVAQEALSNVVRHAAANFATLRLRQADGGLSLAVSDDGVGFDRETLEKGMRLGLLSMRERVRLVNGTLDMESAPGHGTAILAWVPAEMESQ